MSLPSNALRSKGARELLRRVGVSLRRLFPCRKAWDVDKALGYTNARPSSRYKQMSVTARLDKAPPRLWPAPRGQGSMGG